jgi:hypothetical protein
VVPTLVQPIGEFELTLLHKSWPSDRWTFRHEGQVQTVWSTGIRAKAQNALYGFSCWMTHSMRKAPGQLRVSIHL